MDFAIVTIGNSQTVVYKPMISQRLISAKTSSNEGISPAG